MNIFFNRDTHTRIWTKISVPATGRTLQLDPGESAELDLPEDYEDPYLKLKPLPKSHRSRARFSESAPEELAKADVEPQGTAEPTVAVDAAETAEE